MGVGQGRPWVREVWGPRPGVWWGVGKEGGICGVGAGEGWCEGELRSAQEGLEARG